VGGLIRVASALLSLAVGTQLLHCAEPRPGSAGVPSVQGYEVVRSYPHDPSAFTQGLAWHDGSLYEGTGGRGASVLRRVELDSGTALQEIALPDSMFGEGIAIVDDRIYQLTWQSRVGFVYDRSSFELLRKFQQVATGWGLTYDGEHLIQSDGTSRLYFLDPESMEKVREVVVHSTTGPVDKINELEFIGGELYANVWHADEILRISPLDGSIVGRIDMSGLFPPGPRRHPEAVLNGIAYDATTGRIFVTGKLWPNLFEIRFVERR
jgi:glutamine cyclotransferase